MQSSTTRQTLAAIALITVAMTPSVYAQSFAQWPKQCRADLGRMCRGVANEDDRAILTCLQDNQNKLSQRCRKLMQSYGHVREAPAKRR
jgi:hypothetical protein